MKKIAHIYKFLSSAVWLCCLALAACNTAVEDSAAVAIVEDTRPELFKEMDIREMDTIVNACNSSGIAIKSYEDKKSPLMNEVEWCMPSGRTVRLYIPTVYANDFNKVLENDSAVVFEKYYSLTGGARYYILSKKDETIYYSDFLNLEGDFKASAFSTEDKKLEVQAGDSLWRVSLQPVMNQREERAAL